MAHCRKAGRVGAFHTRLLKDGNLQEITRPLSVQTDHTSGNQSVTMCHRTRKRRLVQVQFPGTTEVSGLLKRVLPTVAIVPSNVQFQNALTAQHLPFPPIPFLSVGDVDQLSTGGLGPSGDTDEGC